MAESRVSGPWARRGLLALLLTLTAIGLGWSPVRAATEPQTDRVSISSTGVQGNRNSGQPSISGDGRFVAFTSEASNLVGADTNGKRDVFMYDRTTDKTRRVSVSSAKEQGNGNSKAPSISANGRFVTFSTSARNLVKGDTNRDDDVFVYNRTTHTTRRVSISSTGIQGDGDSNAPTISANGRFVAFSSLARNLVADDTNRVRDVFVYDRTTHKTRRVSTASNKKQANYSSNAPSISADGRFVTFTSRATNLRDSDTNGAADVFVHDRTTQETWRVSVSSTGAQANGGSVRPSISADGRFVAFTSRAGNLVADDTNRAHDVFVRDLISRKTWRVSVSSTREQSNDNSNRPSMSAHGRFVAFTSRAGNLVADDTNRVRDVFVHDLTTHTTRLVSISPTTAQGNGRSGPPSISADGRFVAFESVASNLVNADTNHAQDVFVRGPMP